MSQELKTVSGGTSRILIKRGETLVSPVSRTTYTEDGILILRYLEDIDYNLEKAKAAIAFHSNLSIQYPVPVMIVPSENANMTKDARDYLMAPENSSYRKASAIIAVSLAHRLIANFATRFYKNAPPTRVFNTEEEALEWLRTFLD